MPGTPQTQTEWEQTVARRVMERTRSTLYIALRYLNAPLGALAPTPDPDPQRGTGHQWRTVVLWRFLGAAAVPQQ